MGRFDLTDTQWERLEPLLPQRKPRTGRPNEDHRTILTNHSQWHSLDAAHRRLPPGLPAGQGGPTFVSKVGHGSLTQPRDLPERYGLTGTVSSRFHRWRQAGVWDQILAALQARAEARGASDWDVHYQKILIKYISLHSILQQALDLRIYRPLSSDNCYTLSYMVPSHHPVSAHSLRITAENPMMALKNRI